MSSPFTTYLHRWQLTADGPAIHTHAASLLPVLWRGRPGLLKLATAAEEQAGYALLAWWAGAGAAQVWEWEWDGAALLMERATCPQSLTALSQTGHDDEACRQLCAVVARLHSPRAQAAPVLEPLSDRFAALRACAAPPQSVLHSAQTTAQALLAAPRDVVCLHGDIHHGNVLDFGARGWLAIDPKGVLGERGFDYANLFCNPDATVACDRARFGARLATVAQAAQLDPQRLLQWILAWAGLSAVWHLEDGTPPTVALQVAQMAAEALR